MTKKKIHEIEKKTFETLKTCANLQKCKIENVNFTIFNFF